MYWNFCCITNCSILTDFTPFFPFCKIGDKALKHSIFFLSFFSRKWEREKGSAYKIFLSYKILMPKPIQGIMYWRSPNQPYCTLFLGLSLQMSPNFLSFYLESTHPLATQTLLSICLPLMKAPWVKEINEGSTSLNLADKTENFKFLFCEVDKCQILRQWWGVSKLSRGWKLMLQNLSWLECDLVIQFSRIGQNHGLQNSNSFSVLFRSSLCVGRESNTLCDSMMERIKRRLSVWKSKYFSFWRPSHSVEISLI